MQLSIALVTALIGVVVTIPTDPLSDVSIADRSVDLLTKRDCADGWFCDTPGQSLCQCNQGKKVSSLSHILSFDIICSYSMPSVHARGFQTSHQGGI
jgi:hypothetical protein